MNKERSQKLDDDACDKLWEVYLNEAGRYDEGLVKSWKEDMDVTLVFSGLYSAVLTAFVIESYKNLQPDPAEQSVALLLYISGQVALSQNVTSPEGPAAKLEGFTTPPPAIACNILWFLSLSLALCCAFLATFVQQWARHFLHRTTVLRSPTAQANLFSFLYFGLKDFGMHTIVEIIPSLLHLSLFSFFAGLVAFLTDVNPAVRWLIVATLIMITYVYLGFTIMPVIALNSPYQTPLSPLAWRVWRSIKWLAEILRSLYSQSILSPHKASQTGIILPVTNHSPSLAGAMITASLHNTSRRERSSLVWTLRSLNSDADLLPFVEALPDVIYAHNHGLRTRNFYLLKPILETMDPEADIISRITSLMQGSNNAWLTDNHRERCRIACPKALWTLAYMFIHHPDGFCLRKTGRLSWFSFEILDVLEMERLAMDKRYSIPAAALIAFNTLSCAKLVLQSFLRSSSATPSIFPIPYDELRGFFRRNLLPNRLQRNGSILDLQPGGIVEYETASALADVCDYVQACILPDFLINSVTSPSHLLTPTHLAMKGHALARASFDATAIFRELLSHLKRCHPNVKTTNIHMDPQSSKMELHLDSVFQASLDLCTGHAALLASDYIARRVELNGNELTVTRNIWDTQWSKIRNFLQAVDQYGPQHRSCTAALREILFCSVVPRFAPAPVIDARTDPLPLWHSILSKLGAEGASNPRASGSARHTASLSLMIKSMILSYADMDRIYMRDFDLYEFIVSEVDQDIYDTRTPDTVASKKHWVRSAFAILVVQLLEALDGDDQDSIIETQETLRYLNQCYGHNMMCAAYHVQPNIASRIATQTRRCCELWQKSPSPVLLTILESIWQMWQPYKSTNTWTSISFSDGGADVTQAITRDLAAAANAIQAARVDVEKMTESRQGSETLLKYEGLRVFKWPDHLVSHLDRTRVFWEQKFPYIIPLPPPLGPL